ncbi:APC family permease [Leucobacter denitrificans]|uniref:APC family permease n=1 Tax=Leucobacter denitrificans TaxID=683042 RepID=A0A7G9S296_9MICO|nr:APC family permease [Leucobacter denitrificans]QNN61971.1 APC family permease [Leucobacter denitrificans]
MSSETGIAAIIPPDTKAQGKLHGNLGVLDVIFTVVAYNGPAVVFMGFLPVLILWGNGLGAPAMILAAGVLLTVVATGLINVSESIKRPGGFYALVSASLGRVVGLGTGFTALLTYFAALLSVYVIGGQAFSDFVVNFMGGEPIPWWIVGLGCLVVVTILGHFNIQFSAKVLAVFLSLEFLLILVYIIAVLAQGGADGFSFESFTPEHMFSGALAVGALFAITIFGGFEATVIFREEVRDPDKTIKRATYGVIALLAGSYAVLAWVFINAYGPAVVMEILTQDVAGASGASVREYVGDIGYLFANVLLFTSAFALQLASHNILTRYVYNFGVDKIFPKAMAATHPRHVSPYKASAAVSIVAVVGVFGVAVSGIPNATLYATVVSFVTYGMIILVSTLSFGIGVYILRNKTSSALHAILIFVAGAIFTAAMIFASVRFDLLSGLVGTPAIVMLTVCWLFILSGVVLGIYLKKNRPDIYANVGRRDN